MAGTTVTITLPAATYPWLLAAINHYAPEDGAQRPDLDPHELVERSRWRGRVLTGFG